MNCMDPSADSLEGVRKILRFRNRHDIADLLESGRLELDESDQYGSYLFSILTMAKIHAPLADYDRLRSLSDGDKGEILRTLLEIYPPAERSIEICGIDFIVDLSEPPDANKELFAEIEAQRGLMISVATGGPRIQSVERAYKERRVKIQAMLNKAGLDDPNPFADLWTWYGKWSSGDLPSYQSRRQFISDIYGPLIERLKGEASKRPSGIFDAPTGWSKVDRTVTEIRQRLAAASTEEQFQAVGLLCREALISLAQTVFSPVRHPTLAKAALDLTNELQHKRTAAFRQAALCAESTASVVNLIAIISGQRDPQ